MPGGDRVVLTERFVTTVLEIVCYLLAFVLLLLATFLPQAVPYRDRIAYGGLAAWVFPLLVHAVQHAH